MGGGAVRARHLTWLLMAALLGMVAGWADASTVTMQLRGLTVTRVSGQTHLAGTLPAPSIASTPWYVGNNAIQAQSSYIANGVNNTVFNSAIPLASTAAAVATTALKLNPAGLLTSAVASYLLTKGIEYVNGQWVSQSDAPINATVSNTAPATPYFDTYGYSGWSQTLACQSYATAQWGSNHYGIVGNGFNPPRQVKCIGTVYGSPNSEFTIGNHNWRCTSGTPSDSWNQDANPNACQTYTCPSGYTLSGTSCTIPAQTIDQKWETVAATQWPNEAVRDMVRNGVPLPTDKAVFSPPYADVPIADPVIDPVTGKRMQDVARVTPSPTQPDTADVQVVQREVDSAGNPVVNPATNQPVSPEETTDWCKLNPDASGCKPLDEVPDLELEENTITLSISPVSGFGPDTGTCPADRTLFSKGGSPIVWSWGQYCTFAEGIRPLIVGFAWLSALMIVVGVARRNS